MCKKMSEFLTHVDYMLGYYGVLVTGFLAYRASSQWNTRYVLPLWFYRVTVLLLLGATFIISGSNINYYNFDASPEVVAVLMFIYLTLVLHICIIWPGRCHKHRRTIYEDPM